MNTETVVAAFSRAAKQYQEKAGLQQSVARELADCLEAQQGQVPDTILDIGAGTGFLTKNLCRLYPKAQLTVQDASGAMLQEIDSCYYDDFIVSDFNCLPVQDNSYQCVTSSMALQWAADCGACLEQWYRVLKPGGMLAFALPAEGSLSEWQQSWDLVGESDRVNPLLSVEAVLGACQSLSVHVIYQVKKQCVYFETMEQALESVRQIGAKTPFGRAVQALKRSQWQAFKEAYRSFESEQGFPITYEVFYGIIKK